MLSNATAGGAGVLPAPDTDEKRCCSCGEQKALSEFRKNASRKDGLHNACRSCERSRTSYKARPEACRRRFARRHLRDREAAFAHYGNVCAWCGEADSSKLQIDHLHDDGARHRAENPTARKVLGTFLRREGHPEGFQVLCADCNRAKGVIAQARAYLARKGRVEPFLAMLQRMAEEL